MKLYGTIRMLLCLVIICSMLVMPAEANTNNAAQDASVINGCHSADAMQPLLGSGQLITNSQAVFLYETKSDTLMYAWNPDLSVEPASLAKIMTAFVAVEQGNLSDAVTVKQSTLSTIPNDAVSSDLVENEVLTLKDLLYCMMIDSGNDAAAVIADHVGGSEAAFVELMNNKAEELNCSGTTFTNPHGLYDDNQRTTARDMGKILAAALKNENFAEIFGTVYYTVPATNKSPERKLTTGNFLMCTDNMEIYFDERVTGGRTGVARDGTNCLASSAKNEQMELISILIGSASSYKEDGYTVHSFGGYTETTMRLDAGFSGYYSTQVLYKDQVLTQRNVINGSGTVSLGCETSVSTVLPEGVSFSQLSIRFVDGTAEFNAPIKKGDILCSAEIWYGGLCVAYTPLYALNSVQTSEKIIIQREYDPFGFWDVLLIIVIILVVLIGVFYFLRYRIRIRNKIRKWQRKRRWKNRRGGR